MESNSNIGRDGEDRENSSARSEVDLPSRWGFLSPSRRFFPKIHASPVSGSAPVATPIAEIPTTNESSVSNLYRLLSKDKAAFAGAILIGAFLVWSIFEGILQVIDSYTHARYATEILGGNHVTLLDFSQSLVPPTTKSFELLFGTDYYGHSIIQSILYAAPRDAFAGIIVVAAGITIGMLMGTAAALFGGWAETIFMRLTDAFLAVPALILAIAVGILIGVGYTSVLFALIIVWWPTYARFFRGQALTFKRRGFVGAARLCGTSSLRIMFRHIIPNSIDPIIAYAALDFGNVILAYSSLAFLGIGVQPPLPEWGEMTYQGLDYMPVNWWWSIFPALVILAIVISFTLLGDRLQDVISGRTV